MPLGIEINNLAPQLIQDNSAALVQGVRQIGQQISGHLTEIQTKRDLGAMAQEMQGLNVQSNEFPIQLTQMLTRHPLAARDERGQMALSILGKAHGQWQAGEAEARAFNRAMAMQGYRNRAAREEFDYEQKAKQESPQNIPGVGLAIPRDPVTGQPNVLIPAVPRSSASTAPRVVAPGGALVGPDGKELYKNPAATGMTPGQQATNSRLEKKNKVDLLMRQDADLRTEIANAERRLDAAEKAAAAEKDPVARNAWLEKKNQAIQEANDMRKRRSDLQKAIEGIEGAPAVDESVGVLPPLGAVAAEPSVEMIAVIDPNGRPGKIKANQLEAALQNGYKRR